jgi:hypothetical protein
MKAGHRFWAPVVQREELLIVSHQNESKGKNHTVVKSAIVKLIALNLLRENSCDFYQLITALYSPSILKLNLVDGRVSSDIGKGFRARTKWRRCS